MQRDSNFIIHLIPVVFLSDEYINCIFNIYRNHDALSISGSFYMSFVALTWLPGDDAIVAKFGRKGLHKLQVARAIESWITHPVWVKT